MENPLHNGDARAGTVGGTLLVILLQMDVHEMLNTAVSAFIGATVSFLASILLKYLFRRFSRK